MAKAQIGDLIRIVALDDGDGNTEAFGENYKIGDILEVERVDLYEKGDVTTTTNGCFLYDHEYEIHRKAGEEDSEPIEYKGAAVLFAPGEAILPKEHAEKLLKQDAVNSPNHYTQGRFETIEIIEEITQGYSDGYVAYCVGNALKYLARAPFKHGEPAEDIGKAAKYIEFALARLQTQK